MTSEQVKAIPASRRYEICCNLSRFPTLTAQEIGQYMGGLKKESIYRMIDRGRQQGHKSHHDVYGSHHPASPNEDEMLWRFSNQTPTQIIGRFGDSLLPHIDALGLRDKMPPGLRDALFDDGRLVEIIPEGMRSDPKSDGQDEMDVLPEADVPLVGRRGSTVSIRDTDLKFSCSSPSEADYVAQLIDGINSTYKVPEGGWPLARPVIEFHIQAFRLATDGDDGERNKRGFVKDLGAVQKQAQDLLNNLGFEPRRDEDQWQVLRRCIELAPKYLEERGWRQTVVCPRCYAVHPVYLTIYRSVVEFYAWARYIVTEGIPDSRTINDLKEIAQQVVERVEQHPYLTTELRDLGCAWSERMVDGFQSLRERHPDVTWEECIDIMADTLEIGRVCFDESNPFSPVSRLAKDDTGVTIVTTPEL